MAGQKRGPDSGQAGRSARNSALAAHSAKQVSVNANAGTAKTSTTKAK